jgi:hypothetical protein
MTTQIEMAEFAFKLRSKLSAIKDEDLVQFLVYIEKLDDPISLEELAWLDRVHTKLLHRIVPCLDNLDQVRWTLDSERGGAR